MKLRWGKENEKQTKKLQSFYMNGNLNGKFVEVHMVSHRNSCKYNNVLVVVRDRGFAKFEGFEFEVLLIC